LELIHPGFARLKPKGIEQTFEIAFKAHFKDLLAYAFVILRNEALAEEIVQEVFYRIWLKKQKLSINKSLKAYLYKSVYHTCINKLKYEKNNARYVQPLEEYKNQPGIDESTYKIELSELEKAIQIALNDLPERCRTIFQLSRFEDLTYQQIADQLELSIKTVESQMGKALKKLRKRLVDYLP
jgi:RNA polymerase sigma-70 factor (ECF subfamily)